MEVVLWEILRNGQQQLLSALISIVVGIAIHFGQQVLDKYLFNDKYKPKHLKK